MNIFEDIKNGNLPSDNLLFYLLDNDFVDEKNKSEIEKYIKILNNSYLNASIQEKILLNKVLFVLEKIYGDNNALKNFIERSFKLNIHKVDEDYSKFIEKFLEQVELNEMFEILQQLLPITINYSKEEFRSFFNWLLHKLWNIPKYYNHNLWTNFYKPLQDLLKNLRDIHRIDDMMYVEFFTYHIMGNSFQKIDEWKEFNAKITKETIKGYQNIISQLPKATPKQKNKKRIAFIKDRIVFNSPYQVEFSLFKNLMENEEFRENYEIIVYTFNQFEKSFDDEKLIKNLENIGVEVKRPLDFFQQYGYYNNHLDKALTLRQSLIDDDIDIMIAGGVFPILNFLYMSRVAPIQIYYSHGNCAFDIPNIDKRISHFNQGCKEFEWNIINVPIAKEFLVGTEGEKIVAEIIKNDYKQKFGNDLVILGTIGRLVKIDSDEYLEVISEIMRENPNTIYLACGTGNEESIKEKLKKYNIDEKRFLFLGQVKPHVYGWVIDVWINTYPIRQGHSQEEYLAKNSGWVVEGEFLIECKENNDYERIYNNFLKNRPEFFYEVFEVKSEEINENISYDRLRFDIYKKYNKDINEESILKCIENVEQSKDCKDKWFRIMNCTIKNKEYFKMHKWIMNRLWKNNKKYKYKNSVKFIDILQG